MSDKNGMEDADKTIAALRIEIKSLERDRRNLGEKLDRAQADLRDSDAQVEKLEDAANRQMIRHDKEITNTLTRIIALSQSINTPKLVDAICEYLELIGAFGGMTKADVRVSVASNVHQWQRGRDAMMVTATREAA